MTLRRLSTITAALISIAAISIITIAYATGAFVATTHKGYYPTYPKIKYGKGKKAKLLKRGEYLVKLGDCIACHTNHTGGKAFAGGLAIKTPFGTIYTPNITPNKQYGIGNWSTKEFIKAMRKGTSPTGKYYYPAFPYLYFNRVTTKDLIAIKAYLDFIPPAAVKNKKNTMMFPFNWRFLQLGWRMLFFHFQKQGPYKENAKKSADWNRGNYIVQGLGHCAMCHTPSHYLLFKKWSLAAPNRQYDLTGAFIEGFFAPNITNTFLKGKSINDLADVFLKDKLIGGGKVQGPMAEANHDSLKYLSLKDIKAIDMYLITVVSKEPPKPSHGGSGLAAGKNIFDTYCTGCHLTGAGGAPKLGDAAAWDPLIKKGLNTLYKNAVNGIGGMPAKGTCSSCTTQDIQDAVQYMVAKVHAGTANTLGFTKPKAAKPLSLADGKKVYDQYCSACHNPKSIFPGAPIIGDKAAWKPLIAQNLDVLLERSINGYKNMPARGGCSSCDDAQIKAAVKYMVNKSKTKGDYSLW